MIIQIFHILMSVFGFIMNLASESKAFMILFSGFMALTLILNLRTGGIIFYDLFQGFMHKIKLWTLKPRTSPINIASGGVKNKLWPKDLNWNFYDDLPMAMLLKNNGRTAILRICCGDSKMIPYVTGAELCDKYYFVEATFKWSLEQSVEHSIDSHKFCLEMQALHRCQEKKVPFEFLTISYLFVLAYQMNSHMSHIVENLGSIRRSGSVVELPPFDLASLLPRCQRGFYSYGGTYDNGEIVIPTEWFISSHIFGISAHQLEQFTGLCSENGQKIKQNARKVQPMGKRCVQYHL